MNLFDSHCHLEDDRFQYDRRDVMARMLANGVTRCVLAGSNMEQNRRIVSLCAEHPMLFGVVGVHPHDAKTWRDEEIPTLTQWLELPGIVGMGEIGLDYFYDLSPRPLQREVFDTQLQLAYERRVPVVMHVRDAHGDTLEVLRARRGALPSGVLHCYSGSVESAREYLDIGFYLSLAGPVTFKNAAKLREVAAYCPADRLMIETDSPYLAPVPMRGKRNEPAFVRHVAQCVAQIRGLTLEEIARATSENTCRLFGIPAEEAAC